MLAIDKKTKTAVTGLVAERVRLRIDDGPEFTPKYLRVEADRPLSIAILFDVSGSEAGLLAAFKGDLAEWAGSALRPGDEVEFYTVGMKVRRATGFMPAAKEGVAAALAGITDKSGEDIDPIRAGGTRLWDAMYYAANDVAARDGVKVVLALTDGKDTGGRHPSSELMQYSAEHGVALFGLKYDSVATGFNTAMSLGMVLLDKRFDPVCEQTGGIVLRANSRSRMRTLVDFVTLLRTRYILEFPPPPGMKLADEHWLGIELVDRRVRPVPEQIVLAKGVGRE